MSRYAALGIGCRSHIDPQAVLRIVAEALTRAPAGTQLSGLHTSQRKSGEVGLRRAAETLGLGIHFHSEEVLGLVDSRLGSRSERVVRLTGVGSIAEAAALTGAGEGATLIVPKFSADGVSCALAMVPGTEA